ncbi:MAG: GTP cyclohydrolase II [Sphingomicrobium sp.]
MTGGTIRRAIAALRTGRPVRIEGVQPLGIVAVETATAEMLDLLDCDSTAGLLISGPRAAALGLGNQRDSAAPDLPVLLRRSPWLDRDAALALADPGQDFERGPIGPLTPLTNHRVTQSAAAIRLTRSAGLLPALWLVDPDAATSSVSADALSAAAKAPEMHRVARAKLPLDGLPDTQIIAFRASDDGQEHVALVVGSFGGRAPLIRLHSECLTGDVFGSLKCDCGPQLQEALRLIGADGGGILLYLRQEGRGIGLANKLRAYALQDRGLDTVDANLRLGFADDERDYAHAAAILRHLGVDEVRLLTNNPAKVAGLEEAGITVVERVPHHMPTNPHNADYMATKKAKSGHL